jgi:hypothetical protein
MHNARVFRGYSPPTQSRSICSGGESSGMLTSIEAFSKGNNFLPHCVAQCRQFSLVDVHISEVKFKCQIADYYAIYTTVHCTLLYGFTVTYMKSSFTYYTDLL